MSGNQPMETFWEEWNRDPMLSSGQQLYAFGSTVSGFGPPEVNLNATILRQTAPESPSILSGGIQGLTTLDDIDFTDAFSVLNQHVCYVCSPFKSFGRLGDLTRHQNETHNLATVSKYLCPIEKCPRGIPGEGFGRMHHLVSHLKSKKHEIDGKNAQFLARKHNMPKSKANRAQQGA